MAQLQLQPATTGKKNRALKAQIKIDMTPMVDLGFLLITFFIFTTTMGEPHVTKLYMPADGTPTTLGESDALTIILQGNDSVYYYNGKWEEARKTEGVYLSTYHIATGIGQLIRKKKKALGEESNNLMLLIKPLQTSSYQNLMNALDEVMINEVKKYAIIDATEDELSYVQSKSK